MFFPEFKTWDRRLCNNLFPLVYFQPHSKIVRSKQLSMHGIQFILCSMWLHFPPQFSWNSRQTSFVIWILHSSSVILADIKGAFFDQKLFKYRFYRIIKLASFIENNLIDPLMVDSWYGKNNKIHFQLFLSFLDSWFSQINSKKWFHHF